jgi:putative ABC transport system permease protein
VTRPPRLARWMLHRALPVDVREDIAGDLDEVFQRDCQELGRGRAHRHYWRKALSFSMHFVTERMRQPSRITSRAPVSWMDFKLGFRMLVRYPGLTLVGGLAIAFAIALGAAAFQFVMLALHPTLPLAEGDRVVGVRLWHVASRSVEEQASYEFSTWRGRLNTIEDLGAFLTLERNLIAADGQADVVQAAQISAAAFRVARVPALIGRTLDDADERAGAPPVIVLGHRVWQSIFGGDRDVIGQAVRLGSAPMSVVGVMPPGFSFPVSHDVWLPLDANLTAHGRRQGPAINLFGRLAPGATMKASQAELTALGQRISADFPDTHEHIRPEVLPYAKSILDLYDYAAIGLLSINGFVVLLLALVCGNVALLMFARASTRESEILVRTALGAGRRRIVMQLFVEALVLGGVAAIVGLGATSFTLRRVFRMVEVEMMNGGALPFWFTDRLSSTTVIYAALMAVVGAAIAGVVPALKITRRLESTLRQTTAGGGGVRFGGIWTAVIVTQVAVTVAFPTVAYFVRRDAVQIREVTVGFPAEQYLAAHLRMDAATPGVSTEASRAELRQRFRGAHQELARRVAAEPGVLGVTFADLLPRMYHARRFVELDAGGAAPLDGSTPGYPVSAAAVALDYFAAVHTPTLAGRQFHSGDLATGAGAVIVNQSFVHRVLQGRNPIGRRIRQLPVDEAGESRSTERQPGPWLEIVGVVPDMGMAVAPDPKVAGFYQPLPPDAYPVHMAVRLVGEPTTFGPRLRAMATAIDPALRVDKIQRLDQVNAAELQFIDFWFRLIVGVTVVSLVLSLAGIYAVMSFTVSRRTREIGIRVALGARPARVVRSILRRPLTQVAAGIVAGGFLVAGLTFPIYGRLSLTYVAVMIGYLVLMTAVCLLACIVPTLRALRIEPVEALREG